MTRAAALEFRKPAPLSSGFAPCLDSNLVGLRGSALLPHSPLMARSVWSFVSGPRGQEWRGARTHPQHRCGRTAESLHREVSSIACERTHAWLFPGRRDGHKLADALRVQMRRYVNEATGIDFHPHLIRKIDAKLYLDAEPGGIEVLRRLLGHRDARTTRLVYTEHQNRAANLKYLDVGKPQARSPAARASAMNRVRRALPFPEWPADDRELWIRAFKDEGLFEQSGAACHWAAPRRHKSSTAMPYGLAI